MKSKKFLYSFLMVSLAGFCTYGQETRGKLVGRVTDSSGGILVHAQVRATNSATDVAAEVRSDAAGYYEIPFLIAGTYTLECEAAGFKKFVRPGIELRIGDTFQVSIEMAVGAMTEQIEVRAATPLLAVGEASLGQVVEGRLAEELPTRGGSAMFFDQTTPGVQLVGNAALRLTQPGDR